MFEKKFRVRVSHFAKDWFTVDYAYYRFIPWYNSIMYWFSYGFDTDLESWSTELFNVEDAEEFATNLKSIEDVNEYYRKEKEKESEFYKKKNEFEKKNIPYKSKQIL